MLYTRPKLSPLNIDLAKLSGGGSTPSQFYGRTFDDRPFYIRYRNGWLSAAQGEPGDADDAELTQLISADIGPIYHGTILLEQVCDLLGLTIWGEKPPFTEADRLIKAEEDPVLDWSGDTTYWQELLTITPAGGAVFVENLRSAFLNVIVLETVWQNGRKFEFRQDIRACESNAIIGIGPRKAALDKLRAFGNVSLADLRRTFDHTINLRFDWYPLLRNLEMRKDEGRSIQTFRETFGSDAVVLHGNTGILTTEYQTHDPASAPFVETLKSVIDASFSNRSAVVDCYGTILKEHNRRALHSRDLIEWCQRFPPNYLSWAKEDYGNGEIVVGIKAL